MPPPLTPEQSRTIVVTERVSSVLSLLGIVFVLSTFLLSSSFNKPINRLVFFATFGNLGMNVATLISIDGPATGPASSLCQFQAFMIQMFLGVDAFWALCMACNVYLAFFHNYSTAQLRALDWKYLLGCYGASFIPALVFLFVNTRGRGRVYGPAIIWCWIDIEWDFLRVALLYGIVWVAIIMATVIYCMAGRVIWKKRKELEGFLNPFNENPFSNTITTEVQITHEQRRNSSQASFRFDEDRGIHSDGYDPYTVNVEVGPQDKERSARPAILRMRSLTRVAAVNEKNAEAWLYARVAFLFFLSILITWVPSSVNRVYALAFPDRVNFPLNLASAVVLPLQGFWNVIVYCVTSQTACKGLWNAKWRGRGPQTHSTTDAFTKNDSSRAFRTPKSNLRRLDSDITSVTSLAEH